jgi:hypothetical protein
MGRPIGERLANRHRSVDELCIGGDHGHIGVIGGEIGQGQRSLKGGDSSAGEDHTELPIMRGLDSHDWKITPRRSSLSAEESRRRHRENYVDDPGLTAPGDSPCACA